MGNTIFLELEISTKSQMGELLVVERYLVDIDHKVRFLIVLEGIIF